MPLAAEPGADRASHWKPRFVATASTMNDFDAGPLLHDRVEGLGTELAADGDVHRELGDEAARARRMVSAA